MPLLQVTFHPYLDQNENRYQALGHGKEQETFEAGLERGNIWLMGIWIFPCSLKKNSVLLYKNQPFELFLWQSNFVINRTWVLVYHTIII